MNQEILLIKILFRHYQLIFELDPWKTTFEALERVNGRNREKANASSLPVNYEKRIADVQNICVYTRSLPTLPLAL